MEKMENVYVMDHPLIKHKISMIRNKHTGTNEFRKLIEDIAVLMGISEETAKKRSQRAIKKLKKKLEEIER